MIAGILGRDEPPDELCRRLIEAALQAGGRDNVTAIVARYAMPPRDLSE